MMTATLITDDYSDITMDYPYEVDRVYSNGHIRLKNSPRIYDIRCFRIESGGKEISHTKAYILCKTQRFKKK